MKSTGHEGGLPLTASESSWDESSWDAARKRRPGMSRRVFVVVLDTHAFDLDARREPQPLNERDEPRPQRFGERRLAGELNVVALGRTAYRAILRWEPEKPDRTPTAGIAGGYPECT